MDVQVQCLDVPPYLCHELQFQGGIHTVHPPVTPFHTSMRPHLNVFDSPNVFTQRQQPRAARES